MTRPPTTPAQATAAPTDLSAAFFAWFADNGSDYASVHAAQKAFEAGYRASLPGVPQAASDDPIRAGLPQLPEPTYLGGDGSFGDAVYGYTAEQMIAHALTAMGNLPAAVPQAVAVPEGWVLTPKEITDDMLIAFAEVWYSKVRCIDDCEMADAYAAMLSAIPTTPSGDA